MLNLVILLTMSQCIQTHTDSDSAHILHRLYALQQQFLHISPDSMEQVATQLDLPVSQVISVVDFYSFSPTNQWDDITSYLVIAPAVAIGWVMKPIAGFVPTLKCDIWKNTC